MNTTVDRFGRIVIPKRVRDYLGIEPGTILSIEEKGNAVLLSPSDRESYLADRDGVLVFTGKAMGNLSNTVALSRKKRC